jgi:hypothetical protein
MLIMAGGAAAQVSAGSHGMADMSLAGQGDKAIEVYSVNQYIYIRFDFEYEFATISVYDFLGKQLMREQVENTSPYKMPENLNQGYYIVKVMVDNEMYTKKIYVN